MTICVELLIELVEHVEILVWDKTKYNNLKYFQIYVAAKYSQNKEEFR